MISFASLGQTVSNRRNWPAILCAGALVFLGQQLLEGAGFTSGLWIIALIVLASLAVRPLMRA